MVNSTFCILHHNNKKIAIMRASSPHVKNMLTAKLCYQLLQTGYIKATVPLLLEFDVYSWNQDTSSFNTKAFNAKSECNEISLWQAHHNCSSYKLIGVIIFSSLIIKFLHILNPEVRKQESEESRRDFVFCE